MTIEERYERRLLGGAQRMAARMGGRFVPNERWPLVIAAARQGEVKP